MTMMTDIFNFSVAETLSGADKSKMRFKEAKKTLQCCGLCVTRWPIALLLLLLLLILFIYLFCSLHSLFIHSVDVCDYL